MTIEKWPLPSSWTWTRLDELSDVISKGTTPTTLGVSFTSEGIPFLRAEDVNGTAIDANSVKFHISRETHTGVLARSQLQPGDLLITIAGTLGRVGYVPANIFSLNCNQAVAFVRLKPNLINLPFACFALQHEQLLAGLVDRQKMATIGNLNLEQIREFNIPLPPLSEQQRIAAVLAKADRLRCLRRYALDLGESYLESVFLEMFGQQLEPDHPTIPMGELVTITGGGTPSREIEAYFTGNIPWLTSKDMIGEYISDTQEHITEKAIKDSATKLVPKNSILVVVKSKILMRRVPLAIAKVPLCHGQDIKSIQCPKGLEPMFLMYVLKHNEHYLLDQARGANTEGLTLPMLQAIRVPDVDFSRQQKFTQIVHKYERLRSQQREAARQAEHLFQTLLHRAFVGAL